MPEGSQKAWLDRRPEPPPSRSVDGLTTREKLRKLYRVANGKKRGLILTHDNPDPDSIASAVALASLLQQKTKVDCSVAYGGIIGRAENIAFVKILKLPVSHVNQLSFDDYDLFGLVDTQPGVGNHSLPPSYAAHVVIDHHPLRTDALHAPYADVGGDYGATSTLLVEYLRAAKIDLSPEVASALYYGIKADTRDLGRETTQQDIDSYLWLFPKTQKELLAQVEHPELPARYFRLFHTAIEKAKVYGSSIVTDVGEVYTPDMVAEVAERMMFLQDMKWSLACGSFRNQLYLSLRVKDRRMNAGRLIREICEDYGGSSGGHGSMAGARLPLSGTKPQRDQLKRDLVRKFLQAFGASSERGMSLLSDDL